jgi:uncharacterized protein YqgC (DUF456 family)
MKILAFVSTVVFQLLCILKLKLLDNFGLIIVIFLGCLIGGWIIRDTSQSTTTASKIGWGLLFGSLFSLGSGLLFMLWLAFNFPK